MCFPAFSSLARRLLLDCLEERKAIMAKKSDKKESDKIGPGSVLEKFGLISYDEDTGRLLVSKKFDDIHPGFVLSLQSRRCQSCRHGR